MHHASAQSKMRLVAFDMQGGSIVLDGDYDGLSKCIMGGRVCHKGKLIVE